MKVTGFSFIKNAVKYQYPIVEALRSILPLCDEVVVAVGNCTDGTRELVAAIDPKIRVLDTVWDDSLREGGRVLAEETNKAFHAIGADTDWCIYIQGDEVLHEDGYDEIRKAMQQWKDHPKVDGLLLRYRHFYGSFDYIGSASRWYRNEIRIIRNNKEIFSYKDAQSFRKANNEKLNVKPLQAYMHHYGWVREPEVMLNKAHHMVGLYNGEKEGPEDKVYSGSFDFSNEIDALEKFRGRHPEVMQQWIASHNWKFDYDLSYNKLKLKDRLKNFIERVTGKRPFDFNNYKIV